MLKQIFVTWFYLTQKCQLLEFWANFPFTNVCTRDRIQQTFSFLFSVNFNHRFPFLSSFAIADKCMTCMHFIWICVERFRKKKNEMICVCVCVRYNSDLRTPCKPIEKQNEERKNQIEKWNEQTSSVIIGFIELLNRN